MSDSATLIDQVVAGANAATRVNELFDAASPAIMYGRRASTTTGLTWGYYGGRSSGTLIPNGTVTLTASSTNHVVALKSTGAVSTLVATTNWDNTTDYLRLYKVVTGTVTVTSYEDHRQAVGASGGAGGLSYFTESVDIASPNNTVTAVQLLATQAATNVDACFRPKGTGAVGAHRADGLATGGNKRGQYAVDWQMRRGGAAMVASGAEAVIGGGYNNTASGAQSGVLSGRDNVASGALSVIAGGFSQTASNTAAYIGGGGSNSVSVTYGGILGGSGNSISASGDYGFIGGGSGNSVTQDRGVVAGGANNTASGELSFIAGGQSATTRGIKGAFAHGAGQFAAQGDAQSGVFVQSLQTTNATTTALAAGNVAASASKSIVLPNASLYTFEALISARQNATGAHL